MHCEFTMATEKHTDLFVLPLGYMLKLSLRIHNCGNEEKTQQE